MFAVLDAPADALEASADDPEDDWDASAAEWDPPAEVPAEAEFAAASLPLALDFNPSAPPAFGSDDVGLAEERPSGSFGGAVLRGMTT